MMDRGDICRVDLNPTKGREQQGTRPVMVVSKAAFNQLGIAIVCPIATVAVGQRLAGFTVNLQGAGLQTTGVVLCSQVRSVDLQTRKARRIEVAPDYIVELVLNCLFDILG